eukprot:gene17884-21332_t
MTTMDGDDDDDVDGVPVTMPYGLDESRLAPSTMQSVTERKLQEVKAGHNTKLQLLEKQKQEAGVKKKVYENAKAYEDFVASFNGDKKQRTKPIDGGRSRDTDGNGEDVSNYTTLFLRTLPSHIKDEDLRGPFARYGTIVSLKILSPKLPHAPYCALVTYATHKAAEDARYHLEGKLILGRELRLAWAKNQTKLDQLPPPTPSSSSTKEATPATQSKAQTEATTNTTGGSVAASVVPMTTPSTVIVKLPRREVKEIIDKLARYVAKEGYLFEMLAALTPSRIRVEDAMAFAIDNSEFSGEVVEMIVRTSVETHVHRAKISRVFLISDILSNCTVHVQNVSSYRGLFEARLPYFFQDLNDTFRGISGRVTAFNFKDRIIKVLMYWEHKEIYPKNFIQGLRFTFLNTADIAMLALIRQAQEEDEEDERKKRMEEEDIDGMPIDDDIDGRPVSKAIVSKLPPKRTIDDVERSCRQNGLLRDGNVTQMQIRLELYSKFVEEEAKRDPVAALQEAELARIEEEVAEYKSRLLLSKSQDPEYVESSLKQYRETLVARYSKNPLAAKREHSSILPTPSDSQQQQQQQQSSLDGNKKARR